MADELINCFPVMEDAADLMQAALEWVITANELDGSDKALLLHAQQDLEKAITFLGQAEKYLDEYWKLTKPSPR